jgi:anti-sigma regulatory factor (Ser/Thr protein kinase)
MLYLGGKIHEDTLNVYIEDTAPPYDPRQQPPPELSDVPLEEREPGGLGIFLAFTGVDQYRYENFDGRNRSTFTMRRV